MDTRKIRVLIGIKFLQIKYLFKLIEDAILTKLEQYKWYRRWCRGRWFFISDLNGKEYWVKSEAPIPLCFGLTVDEENYS